MENEELRSAEEKIKAKAKQNVVNGSNIFYKEFNFEEIIN